MENKNSLHARGMQTDQKQLKRYVFLFFFAKERLPTASFRAAPQDFLI